MSKAIAAVLFKAGKVKYEVVTLVKKQGSCLGALQKLVGGNIEPVPHAHGNAARWVAYANEDGMELDLPSNWVGWGTLRHLGFPGRGTVIPGAYYGDVVLCKHTSSGQKTSMTEADFGRVEAAYQAYVKEMGGVEEEEETPPMASPKRPLDAEDKDAAASPAKKPRLDPVAPADTPS